MPTTINPPEVISIHRNKQGESPSALDFFSKNADTIYYKDKKKTVKEVLDELFTAFSPPLPEKGWQKFTDSGDFIVPDGVTNVLVMCIAAGASTMSINHYAQSVFVSRYLRVNSGDTIPVVVGKPQSKGASPGTVLQSKFNDTALIADWYKTYYVDGVQYTYNNGQSPTFPEELVTKNMSTIAHLSGYVATTGNAGPGSGGYAVAADVPDERLAWLELARDMVPGTSNNGRLCYPDNTQYGTAASGRTAGNGANYGGCAGRYANGQGYSSYAGVGGAGLVCVFWGDDIYKTVEPETPKCTVYRKNNETSVTPLDFKVDAALLPYTNVNAGLEEGSTLADALELLYSRLPK